MSEQKRWKFIAMVWDFIENIQKKATTLANSHVWHESSFYRKYRNTSLAIMNNFSSLQEAISMSSEYEVPLIHMSVADSTQEKFIWQFVLNCFQNAQILNQGFIFWPQFSKFFATTLKNSDMPSVSERKNEDEGVIQCYCNEKIYKAIKIKQLPSNEEQIYEILNKLRSQYYHLINQSGQEKEKLEEKIKLASRKEREEDLQQIKNERNLIEQAILLEKYNEAVLDSESDKESKEKQKVGDQKQNKQFMQINDQYLQCIQELSQANRDIIHQKASTNELQKQKRQERSPQFQYAPTKHPNPE